MADTKRLKSGLIILNMPGLFAVGPHGTDTALYYAGGTVILRGEKPEDVAKELGIAPAAKPAAVTDESGDS